MLEKYSKEITQFFALFLVISAGIIVYLWNQPLLFPGLIERLLVLLFFSGVLALLVNLKKTNVKKLTEKLFKASFLGFFIVLIAGLFWFIGLEILLFLAAIVAFFGIVSRLF